MLTISLLIGLLLFTPQEFINLYTYQSQPEVADDETQNEVCLSLDKDEYQDAIGQGRIGYANEQVLSARLLNPELGEYTTKVTVYTPSGDKITFE